MLVEANQATTRLKQAGFNFSEFQEETDLDNNVYITNHKVGIYTGREIYKAKEKASSGKKK